MGRSVGVVSVLARSCGEPVRSGGVVARPGRASHHPLHPVAEHRGMAGAAAAVRLGAVDGIVMVVVHSATGGVADVVPAGAHRIGMDVGSGVMSNWQAWRRLRAAIRGWERGTRWVARGEWSAH